VDAWRRRRTAYGVTNQRLLIVTQGLRRDVRSIALEGLTEIGLRHGASGEGTLTFGRDMVVGYRGFAIGGWQTNKALAPAFEGIEDTAQVLRLIRDAQRALGQTSSPR
jgi:hypothetical protein